MKKTTTLKDVILLSFLGDNDLFNQRKTFSEEIKPGKNIVNNIINYSKALMIIKTKAIDNVHLMLN